jgi:hypothetical protein
MGPTNRQEICLEVCWGLLELIFACGHHIYRCPCVPKQPLRVCLDTFVNGFAARVLGLKIKVSQFHKEL